MKTKIGLLPPFLALVGLGALGPFLRENPSASLLTALVSPQSYLLLASAFLYVRYATNPGPFSFSKWSISRQFTLGLGLSLLPALLFLLIWHLLPLFGSPFEAVEAKSLDISPGRWMTLLLLAPVSEELFFRGILCRSIRNVYPIWVAVLFSALIFAFSHGGFVLGPFILGLITALVYLRSNSILPGMLFHSIANCYVPLVLHFYPSAFEGIRFLL